MTIRPAGCFGKLPVHGDFLRYNAAMPEVQAWDQWWQEGLTIARQTTPAWQGTFAETGSVCFLLQLRPGQPLLFGVLVPSRDRAGRQYPFSIFSAAPVGDAGGLAARVAATGAFLRHAGELATEGLATNDLRSYVGKIVQLAVAYEADGGVARTRELLRTVNAGRLWARLYGTFEDPRKYVFAQNLLGLFPGGKAARLAMHFPLFEGEAEVAFYASWIDRLCGARAWPTLCLWSESRPDVLRMSFDELAARNFLPMMDLTSRSDRVTRVAADGQDNSARFALARQRFATAMDDPRLDGEQLLEALAASNRHG